MKKSLSILFTTLSLSITQAIAHEDPQRHCFPLAHGENGLGSSNSMLLPHIHSAGSSGTGGVYIVNTGSEKVNVKLTLRTYDGLIHTPSRVNLAGAFSTVNSPLELNTGGAILKPLEAAEVLLYTEGVLFTGEISWQADSCIESALSVAIRSINSDSGKFGAGLSYVNGGQPF